MKIVVNNIAASSGGALTILKSFYNYLLTDETAKKHEWIFLLSDKHIYESENIKVIVRKNIKENWLNRLGFDFFYGRKAIMGINPDIVFSMQNTIIYGLNCPQVVYVHQSIPFQTTKKFCFLKPKEFLLAVYQHIIGRLIKHSIINADFTIVQTKWIEEAVIKSTNISRDKIANIMPPIEDYGYLQNNGAFSHNCFFYPANDMIYKNHKCLYEAINILRKRDICDFEVLLTIEKKRKIEKNIIYLGSMELKSVIKQYSKSTLVFPSYIETIGLPLLEAKQLGVLILASDTPFSRETLDDYENAYFFDPFTPEELAMLMAKVIDMEIIKKPHRGNNGTARSWEEVQEILEAVL